ncbi:MAG: PKD domain-containing protein [Candidatus Nanopelagicales bacterium]
MSARVTMVAVMAGALLASTLGASGPATAAQPANVAAAGAAALSCAISPPGPAVETMMDTPVSGSVRCTHPAGLRITYSVAKYKTDVTGPFNGKLSLDASKGNFRYTPGYYPPDDKGKQAKLPEYTGTDLFTVVATATDGTSARTAVNIQINPPPRSCDARFTPSTRTMFNDPTGTAAKQYQMLRYLIQMIDCTPRVNPDGTQASIKFSFYSLSYAPVQAALSAAAKRGVSVQALSNSHADKYDSWRQLAKSLGSNTRTASFAATCWAGCLTPRSAPTPGGPTAWYDAESTSLTSYTAVFKDRSLPGATPIVSWQWDFGDGTKATGPGPHRKKYKKQGSYKTTLTVTDSAGIRHTTRGEKTVPDNLEPMYPSLHSKIYLFSTVGTGARQKQWVSAYSSGNPTYFQSRKGFNNLNVAVGDKGLYDIFAKYHADLVSGSRGELITPNYFRSFDSRGNAATGAKPTTVHFGPQTTGDINRDILETVKCRYKYKGKWERTAIRISMFVFTRKGVAADLWKMAMQKGCKVEIVYTQMSQRVKGPDGRWVKNADGEPTGYGVADCLSTPPTKIVVTKAKKGKPAKRKVTKNSLNGPDGYCSGGTLRGYVPVTSTGVWLNRKSPYEGGSLKVRMSCPVAPKYDPVSRVWAVTCIRNDIFTHNKTMLVNGWVRGKKQKYIMSGSSNFSSPGLRASDEVITEIQGASALYEQYKTNYAYLKKVVAKNSSKKKSKKSSAKTFLLQLSGSQQLDVRGMTDQQLRDQD